MSEKPIFGVGKEGTCTIYIVRHARKFDTHGSSTHTEVRHESLISVRYLNLSSGRTKVCRKYFLNFSALPGPKFDRGDFWRTLFGELPCVSNHSTGVAISLLTVVVDSKGCQTHQICMHQCHPCYVVYTLAFLSY